MKTQKRMMKRKSFWILPLICFAAILSTLLILTGCRKTTTSTGSASPSAPLVPDGVSMVGVKGDIIKVIVTTKPIKQEVNVIGAKPQSFTSTGTGGGGGMQVPLTITADDGIVKIVKKGADITGLTCSGNQLTSLNVEGLSALTELDCSHNKLNYLNVNKSGALLALDCSYNQLTSLDVHNLSHLLDLNCSHNKLNYLNVNKSGALVAALDCSYNQLTSLDVHNLSHLLVLNCFYNKLSSLNVSGCTELIRLSCYRNKLNADAFTKIFEDLPTRDEHFKGKCDLYSEASGGLEGNHKNFSDPPDLKTAFDNAKTTKHWDMFKITNDTESPHAEIP